MFKVKTGSTAPVPVECEVPAYPHRDAELDQICENTHFATEADAWEHLRELREADVHLAARRVRQVQIRLAEAQAEAAEAACQWSEAMTTYQEWKMQQVDAAENAAAGAPGESEPHPG